MSADIIRENNIKESIIFGNCYSGEDFENTTVKFLQGVGFNAKRVGGPHDGGIDIVASVNIQGVEYSYYIQCKYYNKPLGNHPIQEVYSGSAAYGNGGKPVVITNNKVTVNARMFAKKLDVEIIADVEWEKIKEAWNSKKVSHQHHGLMGIIIAKRIADLEYEKRAILTGEQHLALELGDQEEFKLQLMSDFDMAEEYSKQEERALQEALKFRRMSREMQKKAILAYLKHG